MELLYRLKKDATTRNKLLIMLGIMFLLLIGYRIPLPGINVEYLKYFFSIMESTGAGGFLNAITGKSMQNMSIFALSITPYITASILIQLLALIVPSIEAMSKDGSVGHQKKERLTYAVGGLVAFVEALALSIGFGKQGLFANYTWYVVVYATIIWTAGACFLIWIGQTITNKLIGNGISMILLFNILTTLPGSLTSTFNSLSVGATALTKAIIIGIMFIVVFLMFAYVVVLNNAEKRIRITNSGKSGSKMNGADDGTLPLKLNMGGVMPIIFSSSVISVPALIASVVDIPDGSWFDTVIKCLNQNNWFKFATPIYSIGVIIFIILTFFFAYFYAMMSFNTTDIADNLRKNGSIINGIRPGQPTADYLKKQARSVLLIGTTMLIIIALLPTFISGVCGISGLGFGGTTIIIIVGVILELKESLKAQTSCVTYKSLTKRGGSQKNGKRHK